jgi:hypothetical protein
MSNAGSEPKPYPYTIPPATYPDLATIETLDPWHVQEYFRIELLLRSRTVMEMYRPDETALQSPGNLRLMLRYGFGWYVLQGAPYHCLKPQTGPIGAIPGLATFSPEEFTLLLQVLQNLSATLSETERQFMYEQFRTRFFCAFIDPNLPPDLIMKALLPRLNQRHQKGQSSLPTQPYKFNIATWLDYLACYDLRVANGLTYGKIAERIYQKKGSRPRDQAEKAVARVKEFLAAAEHHTWPPQD